MPSSSSTSSTSLRDSLHSLLPPAAKSAAPSRAAPPPASARPAPPAAVPPARPLPAAFSRFAAPLAALRAELSLSRAVVFKSANQHRRTLYFQRFRRLVRLATLGIRDVDAAAAAGAVTSAAALAARARARVALSLARAVAAPHVGAGFANLAVVLAASAAVFWQKLDELASAAEAAAGATG
jgi:hypothetical protein